MPYPYNYTKLWEPIQINGMKLRNRISLSPMGTYCLCGLQASYP